MRQLLLWFVPAGLALLIVGWPLFDSEWSEKKTPAAPTKTLTLPPTTCKPGPDRSAQCAAEEAARRALQESTQPEQPEPLRWRAIVGESTSDVVVVLALTLVAGTTGRVFGRLLVERPPESFPRLGPPDGLGPAQCEYLRTEWSLGVPVLVGTLCHMAERGLITLRRVSDRVWAIRGSADEARWSQVDPVTQAAADALGLRNEGVEFDIDGTRESGTALGKAMTELEGANLSWALGERLVSQHGWQWFVPVVGLASLALAVWASAREWFPATMWALPIAVFALGVLTRLGPGIAQRRTRDGRVRWAEAEGFFQVLSSDAPHARAGFVANDVRGAAWLPYALASDVAGTFVAKYLAETGSAVPQPDWYPAERWDPSGTGGFDEFTAAVKASRFAARVRST